MIVPSRWYRRPYWGTAARGCPYGESDADL